MQIRISDDKRQPSELESLCREIGHQWPPRNQAEAVSLLTKSGNFTSQRIEQTLAMMFHNVDGDELPQYYVSTRGDSEDLPVFTAMLVEGLRKYAAELNQRDPWQGWKTLKDYATDLDIATKTIQRALPDLIRRGLARRKSKRGKIDLRQSAIQELKPAS